MYRLSGPARKGGRVQLERLMRHRVLVNGFTKLTEDGGGLFGSDETKAINRLVEICSGVVLEKAKNAVHAELGVEVGQE